MKKRKISALALAIILSSTAFASCKKDEVKNDGENNVIDETPTVKGENELGLPDDLRFDGETFNMYLALATLKSSYIAQEDAENLLAQTVYKRNELVKQRLGIDLNIVCTTLTSAGADQQTETNKISSLILAGDKTYDVFAHVQHTGMPGLINEGMFLNWNDMPYIDLTKPWWYSNALRDITFGDKIFCMTGDYNLPSFSNTECLAFNKTMLDEADVPTTWEGLCDPALKGKIAYCSPAKSGSAYTQLCTMLFSQPSIEEGWDLVGRFIENLDGKIQDSSGNCHKLVASGEYALGVTIEKSAVKYSDNPDIGFVYPEKNSAVPDGVALIKNCPNPENAKLFIDFVTGLECQKAQNADWARRPVRSDLTPVGLCELSSLDLGDYDFAYAANNKESIVEKWNDLTVG